MEKIAGNQTGPVDADKVVEFRVRDFKPPIEDLQIDEVPALVRESFGRLPAIKGREVKSADQADLADTGPRLLNRFNRLTTSESSRGALAQAIDLKTSETRSASEEADVMDVINTVSQASYDNQYPAAGDFIPPDFKLAQSAPEYIVQSGPAMSAIPEDYDIAFVKADDISGSAVLVSNDLGFRENQVAAVAGFATSVIDFAASNGITSDPATATNNLLALLLAPLSREGSGKADGSGADAPELSIDNGDIRIDGRVISADLVALDLFN